MGTRVHYPAEVKWKVVKMKEQGYSYRDFMDRLGIKNNCQIKTWMRWYRNGETHRFNQPVCKQYNYGKGLEEFSELEKKDLEIRRLKAKVAVLEKYNGVEPKIVVAVIKQLHGSFTVKELCDIFDVPRATYYRWTRKEWSQVNSIEQTIIDLCKKHKQRYGYRIITAVLHKRLGLKVNHKRVLRIMRSNNLLSKARKKKTKVFLSGQEPVVAENVIQRNFRATARHYHKHVSSRKLP